MNSVARQLTQGSVVAVALLLAMAPALAATSAPATPLTIQAISIHGTEVTVTIANLGTETRTGTVYVRVLVNGGEVLASARVAVGGAKTATATLDAGSPVIGAFPLGVVLDDGVPF